VIGYHDDYTDESGYMLPMEQWPEYVDGSVPPHIADAASGKAPNAKVQRPGVEP
jgi:hypothetical protein